MGHRAGYTFNYLGPLRAITMRGGRQHHRDCHHRRTYSAVCYMLKAKGSILCGSDIHLAKPCECMKRPCSGLANLRHWHLMADIPRYPHTPRRERSHQKGLECLTGGSNKKLLTLTRPALFGLFWQQKTGFPTCSDNSSKSWSPKLQPEYAVISPCWLWTRKNERQKHCQVQDQERPLTRKGHQLWHSCW